LPSVLPSFSVPLTLLSNPEKPHFFLAIKHIGIQIYAYLPHNVVLPLITLFVQEFVKTNYILIDFENVQPTTLFCPPELPIKVLIGSSRFSVD